MSAEELMILTCSAGEESWEPFGQQGDQAIQSISSSSIRRTDTEAPILLPPNGKSQLTGKYPDAGKEWRQDEKGEAEDEMVR